MLARLAEKAQPRQKKLILNLATRKLRSAPGGALDALAALGPLAEPALPNIREYQATTDRFERAYIERHVIQAIRSSSAPD